MSEAATAERTVVKAAQPAQPANPQAANHQAANPQAVNPVATNPTADAANRVAELQVTAHLMTLETGLFCVFQTPGSSPPDPATGLPGVRITPGPGLAGRPEAVSVSTFREDGWLNGTAALVRVTDGSAQILVTVYQNKGMDAAPRLQVLRLSGEPTAGAAAEPAAAPRTPAAPGTPAAPKTPAGPKTVAAPEATAEPAQPAPNPEVMAHIQVSGDVGCLRGEWLGAKGSRQWVEGFGLAPLEGIAPEDLEYQAVLGRNWLSPWVESGKFCGSRGMALPLLGLKVRLKGAAAKAFECTYSATFVDGTETGPVSGGETCEAESLAALEAFQIVIHPRDGKPAATKAFATRTPVAKAPAGAKAAVANPPGVQPSGAQPSGGATAKPAARPRAKV